MGEHGLTKADKVTPISEEDINKQLQPKDVAMPGSFRFPLSILMQRGESPAPPTTGEFHDNFGNPVAPQDINTLPQPGMQPGQ